MELQEALVAIPGLSGIIGVIIEILKRKNILSSKHAFLGSIIIGAVIGGLYALENGGMYVESIAGGVIAGATASGVYSGSKALKNSTKAEEIDYKEIDE